MSKISIPVRELSDVDDPGSEKTIHLVFTSNDLQGFATAQGGETEGTTLLLHFKPGASFTIDRS